MTYKDIQVLISVNVTLYGKRDFANVTKWKTLKGGSESGSSGWPTATPGRGPGVSSAMYRGLAPVIMGAEKSRCRKADGGVPVQSQRPENHHQEGHRTAESVHFSARLNSKSGQDLCPGVEKGRESSW